MRLHSYIGSHFTSSTPRHFISSLWFSERLTDQIGADQWASFSKDGDPHLRAEYVKNENPSGDLPLVKASDDGDFEAYI